MALSTETTLTTTWAQVISTGDYVAQNNGKSPIYVFWKATTPVEGDIGFVLMPGAGIDSSTFLEGPVWARAAAKSANNTSLIIVNQ